ncbi:MAG: cyclase family protein [Rhodospirillales bacterium]|nr:cyclase family protein [Rhodospirillales bacterium]
MTDTTRKIITRDGVKLYNLTHPWGHHMPEWPSTPAVNVRVKKFHAKDGFYQNEVDAIMHRGTHMDAPIHVTENTPDIMGYPLWRFFGTGVAVSIPKGKWEIITAEDLENATPEIQEGDIVMINTGMHHKYADTDEYFAYSPGIYKEGAQWLVDKQVKMVGYDVQANDHPMATKLVDHGTGPSHAYLAEEYKEFTGRDVKEDFPEWEAGHKTLMVKGGIPGIENVGGDLDAVTGKRCTFMCFPWRWKDGDGCVVRILAAIDPDQNFRFETGQ